jgi:hypothetical protein
MCFLTTSVVTGIKSSFLSGTVNCVLQYAVIFHRNNVNKSAFVYRQLYCAEKYGTVNGCYKAFVTAV